MLIVIDGPDGSGKTAIAKASKAPLKNAYVEARYKKFELFSIFSQ